MKKIIIVGMTLFLLSLLTLNISYASVLEEDFSSSNGWHYASSSVSALSNSTAYKPETHTNMFFSDGILSISAGYAQKEFSTLSSGIVEAEFEAKMNANVASALFISSDRSIVSGIYYTNNSLNVNHEYGLASYNGGFLCKLLRRKTNDFHKYVIKVNLETDEVSVFVDGEKIDRFVTRASDKNISRISFSKMDVKNLTVRQYYEVDISDESTQVNNIYDSGEITFTSKSEIPEDAFLLAAIYHDGQLISAKRGEGKTVTVTAGEADTVKGFLWKESTLIPLTKGTVSAKKVAQTSENIKALLYDFEKNNSESKFDFSNIYSEDFFGNSNVELYKREIPDDTKSMRNESGKADINKIPSWYSEGNSTEKSEQMLDYLYELSGKKFPDGYQVNTSLNPLYYVLIGDIATAEELIASKTSGYTFTDLSPYYLYFKYGDKLSDTAKENLKTTIYNECINQQQGFKWNKGEGETTQGAHHNQTYDGLVRGLLFGYAFLDDENAEIADVAADILARSEDILDKVIASTAAAGYAIGDYNSPCYGAMIWADLIALSDLLPESDTKAKVDLLLNRVEAEVAVLYHADTANTVGPYARSSFNLASGLNVRQNFPLMMHVLSERKNFYKNSETTGYSFFYPLLAAYTHRIPEYLESIAFDKNYPYGLQVTKIRNSTPDEYLIDPGTQSAHEDSVYKFEETVGYMTPSYSLGSSPDTAWYIPGIRGQDNTFLARWKRSDEVKSLNDTPVLFSYYRYNLGKEAIDGMYAPTEQGLSATAQYKNKAIVYSYPGEVTDDKLNDYYESIYNMGTAIYITYPEDTKIYYGDELVASEEIISLNKNEELRGRLNRLPYTKKGATENIYLEDKNIYAAIIPLNTDTIEIRNVKTDVGGQMAIDAYSINLYNVFSNEAQWFAQEQRSAMRNGYIFEIAEKSEYDSLETFKEHIRKSTVAMTEENGIWNTVYKSGDDALSLSFDTQNLYVTQIKVNGELQKNVFFDRIDEEGNCLYTKTIDEGYYNWNKLQVYKDNPTLFKSANLVQSQAAEIAIGDCTLENKDEAMVYVVYSEKTNTYVVGDLTAGENSFQLKTPHGNIKIDSLDVGFVEFNGDTNEISLSKKVSNKTASAILSE